MSNSDDEAMTLAVVVKVQRYRSDNGAEVIVNRRCDFCDRLGMDGIAVVIFVVLWRTLPVERLRQEGTPWPNDFSLG